MTGENNGIGLYRAHLEATLDAASMRMKEATNELVAAGREAEWHDHVSADLIVARLNDEDLRVIGELIDAAEERRRAARALLDAARRTKVAVADALRRIDTDHEP